MLKVIIGLSLLVVCLIQSLNIGMAVHGDKAFCTCYNYRKEPYKLKIDNRISDKNRIKLLNKFRQFIGLTADGSKLDQSTLRIEVDYTEAEYILEMLEVDQMAIETIEGK